MGASCSKAKNVEDTSKDPKSGFPSDVTDKGKNKSKVTQPASETLDKLLEVADPTKTSPTSKDGASRKESKKDKKKKLDNKENQGAKNDEDRAGEQIGGSKHPSAATASDANVSDPSDPNSNLSPSGTKREGTAAGSANEPRELSIEDDGADRKGSTKIGTPPRRNDADSHIASPPQSSSASVRRGESAESDAGSASSRLDTSVRSRRSRADHSQPPSSSASASSASHAQDAGGDRYSSVPGVGSATNYHQAVETLNRVMDQARDPSQYMGAPGAVSGYGDATEGGHPHPDEDGVPDEEEEEVVTGMLFYIDTSDISTGWTQRYVVIHCDEKNFCFHESEDAFNSNRAPLEPSFPQIELPDNYPVYPAYTLTNTLVSTGKRAAKRALEVLGCRLSHLGPRAEVPCYLWLEGQASAERSLCVKEGRTQPLMIPFLPSSTTVHTLCQTPIPPSGVLLRARTPEDAKLWKNFFMESGAIDRKAWDIQRDKLAKMYPVPDAAVATDRTQGHGQQQQQHAHGDAYHKESTRESRDPRQGRHGTSSRTRN